MYPFLQSKPLDYDAENYSHEKISFLLLEDYADQHH